MDAQNHLMIRLSTNKYIYLINLCVQKIYKLKEKKIVQKEK